MASTSLYLVFLYSSFSLLPSSALLLLLFSVSMHLSVLGIEVSLQETVYKGVGRV